MCIIIVKKLGTILPRAQLIEATWNNGDGIGYYAKTPEGCEFGKQLNDRGDKWERVCELAARKDALLVFHARIATHGAKSNELCHPFPIPAASSLLFHNGMITSAHDGGRNTSDTSCFAELANELITEGYRLKQVIRAFERELGWSKLVAVNIATGGLSFWNKSSFIERAKGKLLYSNDTAFVSPYVGRYGGFSTNHAPKSNAAPQTQQRATSSDWRQSNRYDCAWDNVKWDDYGYPKEWDNIS